MTEESTSRSIARFLEHTELFRGVDPAALEKIARAMVVQDYPAGALIIRQGTEGNALFLIARGRVSVLVEDAQVGVEQAVAELRENEVFGEMSVLLAEPRTASVRAVVATTCVVLSQEAFQRIVIALPQVGLTVSRNLARRLQEQNRLMGFRFVRLADYAFDPELYSMVPAATLERHQVVPVAVEGDTVVVAMTRPNDPAAYEAIRAAFAGYKLRPVACAEEDYRLYLQRAVHPALGAEEAASTDARAVPRIASHTAADVRYVDPEAARRRTGDVAGDVVVRLFNEILAEATNRNASDIHIEPTEELVRVRIRVDGRLFIYREDIPHKFQAALVSRIKIMGGMDISERRRPQDGRASYRIGERAYDVRFSTLPSLHGEKAVMRILDASAGVRPIAELILSEPLAAVVRKAVFRPNGGILVVGPTGSGKTTTLYSTLNERKEAANDLNIVTVEDPIEYTLEGVTQTQVSDVEGMGFAGILRALLRQDPDIIMLGEMRDQITAQIALEAALTGHVVLSTLHADGAIEATTRLIDMGCAPYLVASAVDLVVAQRLLRRICPECRAPHAYSELVRNNLDRAGIVALADSQQLFKGAGCSMCHRTGYLGRVGAYEILRLDDALREAVGAGQSEGTLRRMAIEQRAMTPFKQYCSFMLRSGLTTPAECLRSFGAD